MIHDVLPQYPDSSLTLLFTDLDGTLLDTETYRWDAAAEGLELVRSRGVPVILTSSKTRAEIETLRNEMSLSAPFISENGGGVFFPVGVGKEPPTGAGRVGNLWKRPLGISYHDLLRAMKEIRAELGYRLRGFSDMSTGEIRERTGLDERMAKLAARREFDEPFVIRSPACPDRNALHRAAAKRGLTITEGGRFFHLHGDNNKGRAMEEVLSFYRRGYKGMMSVALGDSPNDFSMLERADYPVLVRSAEDFPDLLNRIPGLRVTLEKGPRGWNEAVVHLFSGEKE